MILKGSRIASIDHARKMAAHLTKSENEVVKVWEANGTSLEDSLVQMQLLTKLTRGQRGIYSVAINPRAGEDMTREDWDLAVEKIEKELGFVGQPRSIVYHEKDGRAHIHVCWSMVDQERGKLLDPQQDRPRLQSVAQALEQELGHAKTRRHANDNTVEITDKERMQESRTGRSVQERKDFFVNLWNADQTPEQFIQAVEAAGYILARGDKARILVVDRDGEPYNLVRQVPKIVRTKAVREKFAGITFPTYEEAKIMQQERTQPREDRSGEREDVKTPQPLKKEKQAPEKPLKRAKELFSAQKDEITKEVERSPHDSGKKPRLSEAGESLSRLERRTKRKYSANTLVGLMSQYLNLSDEERQKLHADLKAKLDADQEAFKRKTAQEKAAELNRKREDHERD